MMNQKKNDDVIFLTLSIIVNQKTFLARISSKVSKFLFFVSLETSGPLQIQDCSIRAVFLSLCSSPVQTEFEEKGFCML